MFSASSSIKSLSLTVETYNWTWNDCWIGLGGDIKGLVLWYVVVVVCDWFDTVDALLAHSVVFDVFDAVPNRSDGARDFDRDCDVNDGARFGIGDAFLTISVNHCSAFGKGLGAAISIGTIWKKNVD